MELLPLQRKPPGKIVSVAIDCLLRAVYNAKDLDEWGRIVSGQRERLPQSLIDIVGGDFFDEKQVSVVMSFVLDLLRGSDKLADWIAFLKVLRKYVDHIRDAGFQDELRTLCRAAAIDAAAEADVAQIHGSMQALLDPCREEKPPPNFQKALVFFPTGIAFCSMVETEVRLVSNLAGLDMDLKEVEESLKAWPQDITVKNASAAAENQVFLKIPTITSKTTR